MNENIIAWNVTNWVTVILMAAIGFFLVGVGMKWFQARNSSAPSPSATVVGATSLAS